MILAHDNNRFFIISNSSSSIIAFRHLNWIHFNRRFYSFPIDTQFKFFIPSRLSKASAEITEPWVLADGVINFHLRFRFRRMAKWISTVFEARFLILNESTKISTTLEISHQVYRRNNCILICIEKVYRGKVSYTQNTLAFLSRINLVTNLRGAFHVGC